VSSHHGNGTLGVLWNDSTYVPWKSEEEAAGFPACHAYVDEMAVLRVAQPGSDTPYLSNIRWAVYERVVNAHTGVVASVENAELSAASAAGGNSTDVNDEWLQMLMVQYVARLDHLHQHIFPPVWMLYQFNRTRYRSFSSFSPLGARITTSFQAQRPLFGDSADVWHTSAPRVSTNASGAHVFPPFCSNWSTGNGAVNWAQSSWSPRSGCFGPNHTFTPHCNNEAKPVGGSLPKLMVRWGHDDVSAASGIELELAGGEDEDGTSGTASWSGVYYRADCPIPV
jgi:hypothetical protein